jgi:hypothetical protein
MQPGHHPIVWPRIGLGSDVSRPLAEKFEKLAPALPEKSPFPQSLMTLITTLDEQDRSDLAGGRASHTTT